jgi:hypothetical protein
LVSFCVLKREAEGTKSCESFSVWSPPALFLGVGFSPLCALYTLPPCL